MTTTSVAPMAASRASSASCRPLYNVIDGASWTHTEVVEPLDVGQRDAALFYILIDDQSLDVRRVLVEVHMDATAARRPLSEGRRQVPIATIA